MAESDPGTPPPSSPEPALIRWLRRMHWGWTVLLIIAVTVALHTLLGLLLLAILAMLLSGARQSLAQARRFADIPVARIRSAAQGYAELVGTVADQETPLRAPLSDTPCHYWELRAQRLAGSRRNRSWQTISIARARDYLLPLEDGTGTCYLMINGAELHGVDQEAAFEDTEALQPYLHHFPEAEQAALAQPGRWRLIESCLPSAQPIYATGLFKTLFSNRSPFDTDWTTGAAAGSHGQARALAEWANALYAPVREAANAAWFGEMRRLEGVADNAPLQGSVRVHTLGTDERPGHHAPLTLSHQDELGLARHYRRQGLTLLLIAVLPAVILAALLFHAIDPEGALALYQQITGRESW